MSNPIPMIPTPTGEFQAYFGGLPGSSDLAAECKKWEKLCGDLLAQRAKLCDELTEVRSERDRYMKSIYHLMCKDYVCPYTKEELFANAIFEPTMEELIAGLELDQES